MFSLGLETSHCVNATFVLPWVFLVWVYCHKWSRILYHQSKLFPRGIIRTWKAFEVIALQMTDGSYKNLLRITCGSNWLTVSFCYFCVRFKALLFGVEDRRVFVPEVQDLHLGLSNNRSVHMHSFLARFFNFLFLICRICAGSLPSLSFFLSLTHAFSSLLPSTANICCWVTAGYHSVFSVHENFDAQNAHKHNE